MQTGTPTELAEKLSISVRLLYLYLDMMRGLGADISFCKQKMSFEYVKAGYFKDGTKWVEEVEKNNEITSPTPQKF